MRLHHPSWSYWTICAGALKRQRHLHDAVSRELDTLVQLDERLLRRLDAQERGLRRAHQQTLYNTIGALLAHVGLDSTDLTPYERSVSSQNGEDGILVEIFRRIGRQPGHFVEIGAHGTEANCLFLADGLAWSGLFIEADSQEAERLERRYTARSDVSVLQRFVTVGNVESLLAEAGTPDDFDLLSIDIDGNDFWIW